MSENSKKTNVSTLNKQKLPTAIALIVIGILFCALRSSMVSVVLTIVGAVLIVVGLINLFNKVYAEGAVSTIVGIIIIACGWTIINVTLLILGIATIIYAIYMFAGSIEKFKTLKGLDLALAILTPLFILIVGILLMVSFWKLADAIFIVLGVVAILDGIMMLIKK